MNLDVDHVLFWMDAIRNSTDRYRTLESFWKGQVKSKIWLINSLLEFVDSRENNIVIHGGWNGVLSSLLFQSSIKIKKLVSVDIDPACEEIANTINKIEEIEGRFTATTCDMVDYSYTFNPDIVINTSCEHITSKQYILWLNNIPKTTLIVLQSNNYNIPEHIRISNSLEDFKNMSNITTIFSGELELMNYKRYMLIGYKK